MLSTEPRQRKVIVVDDHPLVCQGLIQLINQESDLVVSCEARDAHSALFLISKSCPDIAIVDISLKDISGLELTRIIKERFPSAKVLILSMHDEILYAERALKAGAGGYIMKEEPPEKVLEAIRLVLAGDVYVSNSISNRLLHKAVHGGAKKHGNFVAKLSDRELEVFQLIGLGLGTREIANKLFLSVKTVETYQANIKQKLHFKTGRELMRYAVIWLQNQEK